MAKNINVKMTEAVARARLARIDGRIAGDRDPILKDETKAALLVKARQYEEQLYGKRPKQPSLFERLLGPLQAVEIGFPNWRHTRCAG